MTLAPIVILAVITMVMKGAGSLLPELPPALVRRLGGVAPALLAALVYVEVADGRAFPEPTAKAAGVGVAVALAAIRAPLGLCVIAGAAVAAGLRAFGAMA